KMAYSVGGKTGQDQLLLNLKIRFDCHIELNPLVSFSMALTPYATVFEGDEISSWYSTMNFQMSLKTFFQHQRMKRSNFQDFNVKSTTANQTSGNSSALTITLQAPTQL
ncbi:hypothetical protein QYM36_005674, partial [Artemia franciscana]